MKLIDRKTNMAIEILQKGSKPGTYLVRRLKDNVKYIIPKEDIYTDKTK